jgi:E3 ubiquitin-protein ligase HUWE1
MDEEDIEGDDDVEMDYDETGSEDTSRTDEDDEDEALDAPALEEVWQDEEAPGDVGENEDEDDVQDDLDDGSDATDDEDPDEDDDDEERAEAALWQVRAVNFLHVCYLQFSGRGYH